MEAPDSVPGSPRGGEPRRPLRLHQARLPAAPSAGGPALIVLVPQGPGELRQADWLPCSPCRPSQVGSARLHPPPLPGLCLHPVIISPDACRSLSSESFCHLGSHGCGSPPGPTDRPPRHPTSARALAPSWGSSEHCWEKPLARTLVEQKLLTSSFLPSRGGMVTFSKAAQGPDGSWRWILP